MNNQMKDGGAAFPGMTYISQDGKKNPEGMTLRDYFAAAALQGMLGGLDRNTMRFLENTEYPSGKMASAAYNIADAMIKAREAKL